MMKKPEIKFYHSPDISNLWCWEPINNEVFYLLEMNIGFTGENKSDVYSVIIATTEGINKTLKNYNVNIALHKMIIVEHYEWNIILSYINDLLSKIEVYDQCDFQQKLSSLFYWEYENRK